MNPSWNVHCTKLTDATEPCPARDGNGNFKPIPLSVSGLFILGDILHFKNSRIEQRSSTDVRQKQRFFTNYKNFASFKLS